MNEYLKQEIDLWGEYMESEDIAKFIIQAYTGPFHSLKEPPNVRHLAERLKKEFNDTHLLVKQREIFQQISQKCIRIHTVPFLRKYKSMSLLTSMFVESFSFLDETYLSKVHINSEDISGVPMIEKVTSIIDNFNNNGEMVSHSIKYKENVHPAYIVSVNEVIKKYMKVL